MQCKVTPEMLWQFRRKQLGGKSAVSGAPLPERLEDCNPEVQADHYSQACYAMASYELSRYPVGNFPTPAALGAVPVPPGVSEGRASDIKCDAFAQLLTDYGIC